MTMYKLSDFGLNKQSLTIKLNEITNVNYKVKLVELLKKRTTEYELNDIEYIINGFYSGVGQIDVEVSSEPLSIYYAKKNKEATKMFMQI